MRSSLASSVAIDNLSSMNVKPDGTRLYEEPLKINNATTKNGLPKIEIGVMFENGSEVFN